MRTPRPAIRSRSATRGRGTRCAPATGLGLLVGLALLVGACDRGRGDDDGPAPKTLEGDPAGVDVDGLDDPIRADDPQLEPPSLTTPVRLAPDGRAQVRARPAAIADTGLVDLLYGAVRLELRLLTTGLREAWRALDEVAHVTCVDLSNTDGADVGCVAFAGQALAWERWWDAVTLTVPVVAPDLEIALWVATSEVDADTILPALEPTLDDSEVVELGTGRLAAGRRGDAACAVWITADGVLLVRRSPDRHSASTPPLAAVAPVVRHSAAWLGAAAAQNVPLRDDAQEVVAAFDGRGSSWRLRAKGTSLASALRLTSSRHGASQTQLAAAQQGFGLLDERERRRLARERGVPEELMDAALLLMRGTSIAAVGRDALVMTSVDIDDLRAALPAPE